MKENAVQNQFYKDLSYNQLRDIVPLRKREWDGMIISALDDKKPYMYENYYDMIYTFFKGRYPTSRNEAIFYEPEKSIVPTVSEEFVFLLKFNEENGATTFIENVNGILPQYRNNCATSSAQSFEGTGSLKTEGVAGETGNDVELVYGNYGILYGPAGTLIDVPDTFEYGFSLYLPTESVFGLEIILNSGTNNSRIYLYIYFQSVWKLQVIITDSAGTQIIPSTIFSSVVSTGIWNNFVIRAKVNSVLIAVNNTTVTSVSDTIDIPLSGMENFYIWESNTDDSVWIDKVYIKHL